MEVFSFQFVCGHFFAGLVELYVFVETVVPCSKKKKQVKRKTDVDDDKEEEEEEEES